MTSPDGRAGADALAMRLALVGGLVALAIAFAAAFGLTDGGDYANPFCAEHRCDDAAPAIDALSHGRVADFFDAQPAMGSFSLLLRAPVAAVARGLGGGASAQYQAGAFVCLLAAVMLAAALALELARRGVQPAAWIALAALCIVNPAGGDALQRGHPEEILAATLLAGGAFVAGRRPLAAGVLLGLAIATKQWALLGLAPVAFLAPAGERMRLAAASIGVAALLALPMAAGDFGAFREATRAAANPPGTVKPLDIWFAVADPTIAHVRLPDGSTAIERVWTMPHALDRATHWLIVGLCALLIVLWWRRGARAGHAALLLALLLLLRVLLDPRAHAYHHAPLVLALAVAETMLGARFPWRTLAISALLAVTLRMFDSASWTATNVVYLAWAVPATVLLAGAAFGVTMRIPGARTLR